MPGSLCREQGNRESVLESPTRPRRRPHTPCHMIRPATTIALDGRERRHVQSATRRGRARHKAVFGRLVRAHARDVPKVTTILPTKNPFALSDFIPVRAGTKASWARVRSIFGSNLAGGVSGIPPGYVRCRRTSNIAWQRRCAARCTLTIRALVCGSYSITAPATYSSQQYGRLSLENISIRALKDNGRRG